MTSVFARFEPRLQQAIVARLGWTSLRPVQDQAGEALLDGHNAVVLAPTAGGKTEASMFPALSQMVKEQPEGVGALYIAPIKALLNNQAERLGMYTEMVGLRRFVWHGDVGSHERKKFLKEPSELLMTTPESLEVMLVSQRVNAAELFHDLRIVVIDEVHALAGSDRGAHLMSVLERLAALSRHDVQRVGLSATVGNPDTILEWIRGSSERPGLVVDPPKPPAKRELLIIHRPDLASIAHDASAMAEGKKSLFFCQSRSMTEAVADQMRVSGIDVHVHHSAVSAEERQLAEENFHRGSNACIVCTSTLELGIDVGDLDRALQAEAPDSVSSFMQRMGRTGRRDGQSANTTFFCETSEGVLQAIALIELAKSQWVESVDVNTRCWPVLIHQLLAMALAENGIADEVVWRHLSKLPDFRDIHRAEFDRLIEWMLADRSLVRAGGRLVLGPKAEKRFGRRNFMELFAVFSSPQSYTVQTMAQQVVGTLNQQFVDRLVDGVSSFLLGGRAWAVVHITHDDRRITVEPAPRGRQPSWGGYLPMFLGEKLCTAILGVLTDDADYAYLHPTARAVLAEERDVFASATAFTPSADTFSGEGGEKAVNEAARGALEATSDGFRWWTFAGGRINATLRYALQAIDASWKLVPDNFGLRIEGDGLSQVKLLQAIDQLTEPEFWDDDALWTGVAGDLPNYRLSKFQPLMPPWVEREVVASYLLDVGGAWEWLTGETSARERLPAGVTAIGDDDVWQQSKLQQFEAPSRGEFGGSGTPRDKSREITWVRTTAELQLAVDDLANEACIGIDVETTLRSRTLCLIQIASPRATYLIDVFDVSTLEPLRTILESAHPTKLAHNASFERGVLARQGFALEGVVDTLAESRRIRGRGLEGGHSLRVVCERELGLTMSKAEQTSDWTRRPLTESQVAYAAFDAEVLLSLWDRFRGA